MSALNRTVNRPLSRLAAAAPVIARVTVGLIMLAHGWQKVTQMGAANFGGGMLADLGIPAPVLFGYVVAFGELIGGAMLIVGLLTRLVSVFFVLVLGVATLLVKADIGLIAGMGAPLPGAELDLALIAGALVTALLGPGRPSLDHVLSLEEVDAAAVPVDGRRGVTA